MRQLKFRAWDKVNKKWLLGYEMPNLGGFSLTGECVILGEFSALFRPLSRLNEIEIMQYTGLKDKSGKEIFEGDIVKCWKKHSHISEADELVEGFAIAEIVNSGWTFYFKEIKSDDTRGWFFYGPDGDEFSPQSSNSEYEWMEVIGNRYESTDLGCL